MNKVTDLGFTMFYGEVRGVRYYFSSERLKFKFLQSVDAHLSLVEAFVYKNTGYVFDFLSFLVDIGWYRNIEKNGFKIVYEGKIFRSFDEILIRCKINMRIGGGVDEKTETEV